jgi:hypothetical protein
VERAVAERLPAWPLGLLMLCLPKLAKPVKPVEQALAAVERAR